MGTAFDEHGDGSDSGESFVLHVDDRGRVTIPKSVRERLGIEPDSDVPASVRGSILTIDPKPSGNLQTATAERTDWAHSTPTDAGESLFGPMETE
jgi:AbrB family looped-hinge helix DNA binding protein